jgi:hypothetical protein
LSRQWAFTSLVPWKKYEAGGQEVTNLAGQGSREGLEAALEYSKGQERQEIIPVRAGSKLEKIPRKPSEILAAAAASGNNSLWGNWL